MREIITLQIGGCGNNIGTKFWEVISDEHGIDCCRRYKGDAEVQLQNIEVYFHELENKFLPRALLIDLEPNSIETIKAGNMGKFFHPNDFIFGIDGTGNNFARGHADEAGLCESILDGVHQKVEQCDSLEGFQIVHSVAGGTGSGLGSLLMKRLRDEYDKKIICTFSVLPRPKVSDTVLEPYNASMSLHTLLENTDETYIIDNEALCFICNNVLKLKQPTKNDLNHIVAAVMSGVTTCLRFPGQFNIDLRKIKVNMVPFPELHFFIPGFVPLVPRGKGHNKSVPELVSELFNSNNLLCKCEPKKGKYLTVTCLFRGKVSPIEINQQFNSLQDKNSDNFVEWLPNNINTGICNIPPRGLSRCATFIGNNTEIHDVFKNINESFEAMYNKKAFSHWYTSEGMEESEFTDVDMKMKRLISIYKQYDQSTTTKSSEREDDEETTEYSMSEED